MSRNCSKLLDGYIIPKDYLITNLVFDKDDIRYEFKGRFLQKSSAKGTALQLGSSSKRTSRIVIEGAIRVERKVPADATLPSDWKKNDTTGLRLLNLYESEITVGVCDKFRKGLVLEAKGKNGCVYNNIHLLRIKNNQVNLSFETSDNGWTNQNTFFGGSFLWDSTAIAHPKGKKESNEEVLRRLGTVHISIPSQTMNGNTFYSQSLESPIKSGKHLPSGKFIYCNGKYNKFISPRLEGDAIKIHFGDESLYNDVFAGYLKSFVEGSDYIDKGSRNKVYGRDFLKLNNTLISGGRLKINGNPNNTPGFAEGDALVDVKSTNKSSEKLFKGSDTQGNEVFTIDGYGNGLFAGNIKVNEGIQFRSSNDTADVIDVKNKRGERVFGVRADGLIQGNAYVSSDIKNHFFVPFAIRTSAGPPHEHPEKDGVTVLSIADNCLYIYLNRSWKKLSFE